MKNNAKSRLIAIEKSIGITAHTWCIATAEQICIKKHYIDQEQ